MNANRKSDEPVVPATSTNEDAAEASAESAEERGSTEKNAKQDALCRTQDRKQHRSGGLHGVREAARKDRRLKFTNLLHHVDEDCLTDAFFNLKKSAAVGVDGVTWEEYERNVEANITDLHDRIHRGAYRAKPCRRTWIPKPDGRQRPLGIASLEDKIVQQAVVWVIQSIYEQDFLSFSYGFRPDRSCHQALDALTVAICDRQVNWIVDADIQGFFDAIDHSRLIECLEHRIGDRRILRLIRKWLRAGVSEDGQWSKTTVGTPQGAVISPLLANLFLHYALDEWMRRNYPHVRFERYGQMTMALIAQAVLNRLRHRLGEPYNQWDANHLARSILAGWIQARLLLPVIPPARVVKSTSPKKSLLSGFARLPVLSPRVAARRGNPGLSCSTALRLGRQNLCITTRASLCDGR